MSPVASAVFVQKVFKEDKLKKIGDGKKKLEDYEIPGFDMLQFVRDAKEIGEDVFAMHRMFVEKVLGMEGGGRERQGGRAAQGGRDHRGGRLGPVQEVDDEQVGFRYSL